MSGKGSKKIAGTAAGNQIIMPAIKIVKAGETADLTSGNSVYKNGSEKVHALANNGTMGDRYEKGANPTATEYSITETGRFTPPVADGVTQYIVEYNRTVTDGIAILNKADKFPQTVRLVLKVLAKIYG